MKDNAAPSPEKLAQIGTLTSGLAHELRNPLNAIKANLQLMEEDMLRLESGEGQHTRRVRRLLKEVGRLDKILTDFLLFVRSGEYKFEKTDLSALLHDVVSILQPQADAAGVMLLADLAEVTADVDAQSLKQAVMNLAINGLQAMEPVEGEAEAPGRQKTLMLKLQQAEANAVIEVIDTGRGIPAAEQSRVFELFYTSRRGGTGIGLAMVAKTVQAHGGEIQCSSEEGKGTSFRIILPVNRG